MDTGLAHVIYIRKRAAAGAGVGVEARFWVGFSSRFLAVKNAKGLGAFASVFSSN